MPDFLIHTILVVGEDHQSLINDFSEEKVCPKHVVYRYDDAEKLKMMKVESLMAIASRLGGDKNSLMYYEEAIREYESMDAFDYYLELTDGMEYDEETGDAMSECNPNAKFKFAKCNQKEFESSGREGAFSKPFTLKDGTMSYSCNVADIDWNKEHMNNVRTYERAWEICVEGSEPKDDTESMILENMGGRKAYFANFKDKQDYVRYNCSFWTYGIIVGGKYYDVDGEPDFMGWVEGFYDRFIAPLLEEGKNDRVTIYEVKSI